MNPTSQLDVTPIFSSFLCRGQLNIDHDRVTHWIEKQIGDNHGRIKLNLDEPELVEYYTEVRAIFNDLHQKLGLRRQYHQDLKKGWVNTNWDERFGIAHKHPEATFISIYYPKIEGKHVGHLEMVNPNPTLPYVLPSEANQNSVVEVFNIYNSNIWRVAPRTGMIVIIPSWIDHFALQNRTNTDIRYSVALDSKIKHRSQN